LCGTILFDVPAYRGCSRRTDIPPRATFTGFAGQVFFILLTVMTRDRDPAAWCRHPAFRGLNQLLPLLFFLTEGTGIYPRCSGSTGARDFICRDPGNIYRTEKEY